jgi:hypothetical protein
MATQRSYARRTRSRREAPFVLPPPQPLVQPLPKVVWTQRSGPALRPDPLRILHDGDITQLDFVAHCPVGSRFRPAPSGTENVVAAYAETARLLRGELASRASRPRAVVLGRGSDPFLPLPEVQLEACAAAQLLADAGIEVWLRTACCPRPFVLDALAPYKALIRITFLAVTLDDRLRRALLPLSASPLVQLKQLSAWRRQGLAAHVSIEPLIHGLTDTRENLEPLLDALADGGVERLSAGYLALRPGVADSLAERFDPDGWGQQLAGPYAGGPIFRLAGIGPMQFLPKAIRQRGYALLMNLAADRGMDVQFDPAANPDFLEPAVRPMRRPMRQQLLAFASA